MEFRSIIQLRRNPAGVTIQILTDPSRFLTARAPRCRYFAVRNTFPAWRTMTHHQRRFGRFPGILFVVAAQFLSHSCNIFAQDSRSATVSSDRPSSLSVRNEGDKRTVDTNVLSAGALPDAPVPQDTLQDQPPPSSPVSGTHLNQFPVLSPGLTRSPLTTSDKFQIYIHKTYGPPAVIFSAFGAGMQMANPKSTYPREWKDGAAAFGRNYGYAMAVHTSRNSAQLLTDVALHEDPRYLRSASTNPLGRAFHALAFTVFDKTDSGRTTLAVDNFASAAAGGFVGMGILPDGFNDVTHAEQHMASEFATLAIGNILTEYEPEWGPWAKRLRIPKIIPAWWVPQR
jgi:hypothetical protein